MQLLLCALLLLENVNVVDVDSGAIVAGRSVLVSEGYIQEVGAPESVRARAGVRVIDANRRYLMPALWDMHTHPMEPEALTMLVANGVGGTRIMWGLPRHLEWRARVELGELPGPRLLIAGPIIEGAPAAQAADVVDTEGRRLVTTYAEAVAEVRRQKAAGFDYIKVYNNVPLEAYQGVIAEADRLEMPVVGHVPFAAGIEGALAARQKSIEHLRGYIEKLAVKDAPIRPGVDLRSRTLAWEYADMSRIPALVRATRDAGVWQCPTLGTSIYTAPSGAIERYLATPEAEYLDPPTREAFRNRSRVKWLSNFTEADFERATRANHKQAALLRAMHEAGVPLLAGTDSNAFGFALHRELEALVEVGISPVEALQTATINPARFAGLEKQVGRVAPGYAADLVLLDANPLEDIRNTRSINAVILRGQLLDRPALDAMLARVKPAIRQP
ncbi:MAG TPA: amidohydrolase family protein [Steroidobacteraceae bacterium]|nr:amidohydrolase family protein [Steroidobacteraceae bacterium]